MRTCLKILPVFIVIWLARKYCEIFSVHGRNWHLAFKDVLVKADGCKHFCQSCNCMVDTKHANAKDTKTQKPYTDLLCSKCSNIIMTFESR